MKNPSGPGSWAWWEWLIVAFMVAAPLYGAYEWVRRMMRGTSTGRARYFGLSEGELIAMEFHGEIDTAISTASRVAHGVGVAAAGLLFGAIAVGRLRARSVVLLLTTRGRLGLAIEVDGDKLQTMQFEPGGGLAMRYLGPTPKRVNGVPALLYRLSVPGQEHELRVLLPEGAYGAFPAWERAPMVPMGFAP